MLRTVIIWGWLAAVLASGQEQPVFRTETSLALVRFHVVRKNAYVDTLRPEDVVLLEDGAPRKITLFEGGRGRQRTVPIEMMLVFDISGSVTHQGLLDLLSFQHTLLDGMTNLRLSVYGFHARLLRFSGPTRDLKQLEQAFQQVLNWKAGKEPRPVNVPIELPPKRKVGRGGTWIYEAVAGAAKDAASAPGTTTRMMLVFSDGFATTDSRPQDVAGLIQELGVPVYPVVLGHGRIADKARYLRDSGIGRNGQMKEGAQRQLDRLEDQERELRDFASLGELTGGRSFDPPEVNPTVLRQILNAMVGQVISEYVVGFSPQPGDGAGKKHKLQVKLQSKELGKVMGGMRTLVH